MDQNLAKQKGFTLIESLLVIVVISIIILFAFNHLRQKNQEKDRAIATKQIENILQVAVSYFNQKGEWPDNLTSLTPDYLSAADICSPWPSATTNAGPSYAACPKKELYKRADYPTGKTKTNAPYYGIKIVLPNTAIAQQLGDDLPTSSVSATTVTAYITAVQEPTIKREGWISSAGLAGNNSLIKMPVCGEDYEGHVIFSPQRFATDEKLEGLRQNKLKYFTMFFSSGILILGSQSGYIQANNGWVFEDLTKRTTGYFLTLCLPNGRWTTITGGGSEGPSAKEFQCDTNWRKYNVGSGVKSC